MSGSQSSFRKQPCQQYPRRVDEAFQELLGQGKVHLGIKECEGAHSCLKHSEQYQDTRVKTLLQFPSGGKFVGKGERPLCDKVSVRWALLG